MAYVSFEINPSLFIKVDFEWRFGFADQELLEIILLNTTNLLKTIVFVVNVI